MFYRELGFDVEIAEVGGYAFVEASGIRFHLSESPGLSLPSAASLSHEQIVGLWAQGESLARMGDVRDESWGMREFALLDPDNNLVRVGTPLAR